MRASVIALLCLSACQAPAPPEAAWRPGDVTADGWMTDQWRERAMPACVSKADPPSNAPGLRVWCDCTLRGFQRLVTAAEFEKAAPTIEAVQQAVVDLQAGREPRRPSSGTNLDRNVLDVLRRCSS